MYTFEAQELLYPHFKHNYHIHIEADMKVADSRLDTDKGSSFLTLHIPRLPRSRLLDYEPETFKWEMGEG